MIDFIVVAFPGEALAREGARLLKTLDTDGSLTVYGSAILLKLAGGQLAVKDAEEGPLGFAFGALLGGILGLFGGAAWECLCEIHNERLRPHAKPLTC